MIMPKEEKKNGTAFKLKGKENEKLLDVLVFNIICNQRNGNLNIEIALFTYKASKNYFSFSYTSPY